MMNDKMFIFPGVGSHHTGMGKEFYQDFPLVRDTFEEAGDVLKTDMGKMIFSHEETAKLNKLENSQTALLTLSVATYKLYMEEVGGDPAYCLGHSLGEYSALCCAGVVRFPDALIIVKERGKILNQVAASMQGIMAWVINLDNKIVENVCSQGIEEGHQIYLSAYDAPKQSSISGEKEAVMTIGRRLEKEGAIVYPLKLSGPFHCPLMKQAEEQLRSILEQYTFHSPIYPVIANLTAALYKDKDCVVDYLARQLTHHICWQASLEYALNQGVSIAVELGPDRVLKHLVQNNTDRIRTFSLNNMKDLDSLLRLEI
jgi:[acyl-carrier-protein] S-malonyltransferase